MVPGNLGGKDKIASLRSQWQLFIAGFGYKQGYMTVIARLGQSRKRHWILWSSRRM